MSGATPRGESSATMGRVKCHLAASIAGRHRQAGSEPNEGSDATAEDQMK